MNSGVYLPAVKLSGKRYILLIFKYKLGMVEVDLNTPAFFRVEKITQAIIILGNGNAFF